MGMTMPLRNTTRLEGPEVQYIRGEDTGLGLGWIFYSPIARMRNLRLLEIRQCVVLAQIRLV